MIGHFALPFVLLLSRDLKRHGKLLARVAIFVILMRLVDLIWLVAPTFSHGEGEAHPASRSRCTGWTSCIPIGLAGLWLFLFARLLRSRALLPFNDPYFKETFAHESH